jgi:hypothetical protein
MAQGMKYLTTHEMGNQIEETNRYGIMWAGSPWSGAVILLAKNHYQSREYQKMWLSRNSTQGFPCDDTIPLEVIKRQLARMVVS